MQVMTIGYEGATPFDFDETLLAHGVEVVVDVRAMAISRRKGFAKTALSERLAGHGLRYVHLRGLGDPKPGRDAARAGDIPRFKTIFGEHMQTPSAQLDLARLMLIVAEHKAALLCYEADAEFCHRSIVASALASTAEAEITHLTVESGIVDGAKRARNHTGQSLAAA